MIFTLGTQHDFTQVPLTDEELKKAGYSTYMPPYRLRCRCGWISSRISQGQGEWETVRLERILHLLENMQSFYPKEV